MSGSPSMCAAAFTPSDLTGSASSSHDGKLEFIVESGVGYGPASSWFSSGSGFFSTSGSPSSISSLSLTPSISFSSSTSVGRKRGHNIIRIVAQQRVAQSRGYYVYYSNLLKAGEWNERA